MKDSAPEKMTVKGTKKTTTTTTTLSAEKLKWIANKRQHQTQHTQHTVWHTQYQKWRQGRLTKQLAKHGRMAVHSSTTGQHRRTKKTPRHET